MVDLTSFIVSSWSSLLESVSTLYSLSTESSENQASRATPVANANASTLIRFVYYEANSGFRTKIEFEMRI